MIQKKLLRTLETITSGEFTDEHQMLEEVIGQLVSNDQFKVNGGRIWKLDRRKKAYSVLFQKGKVGKIGKNFVLRLKEYEIADVISRERTVLAYETNEVLKKLGILRFSASGVGQKLKVGKKYYYEYLIALNSENIDDELRYTINIVATILTSKIKENWLSNSRRSLIAAINKAQQLQRSILPEHEYHFASYELFGITIPAENLGGDFFDYLPFADDGTRLGVVVGDAASKGIAAAAEAMYISGAIRMASTFDIKISAMMRRMNHLVNQIFKDDKFASLFYGELTDDENGLFLYANAGHNPPIFYKQKEKKVHYLNTTGPLLGPAPNTRIQTDSINIEKDDILVIYSDGIPEAANEKFEFYEEKRLERVIARSRLKSPKEIAYRIIDDVNKFSTSQSEYQDDKTIVVIKRK